MALYSPPPNLGGILQGGNQPQQPVGPYQMPDLSAFGNIPGGAEAQRFAQIYEMYQPMANAGLRQIPTLTAGATPEGYNQRIGDILGMESTQNMIGEQQRSLSQALASQGMRRSGYGAKSAADIPQQVAQSIEGQMMGRSQSLFGVGEGAIGQQNDALSAMQYAIDGKEAAANQRSAQRRSQNTQLAGLAIGLLALSDIRLKTDIEKVGELNGQNIYEWEWNETANKKGLFGKAVGLIAQEVQRIMPAAVHVRPDGYLMVDYRMALGGAA